MTLTVRGAFLNVRAISESHIVSLTENKNQMEEEKWVQVSNIVKL